MKVQSIEELHKEHLRWRSALLLAKEELKILHREGPQKLLQDVERLDSEAERLLQHIESRESTLRELLQEGAADYHDLPDHDLSRKRLERIQSDIKGLLTLSRHHH